MRFARRLLPIALCAALAAPGLAAPAATKVEVTRSRGVTVEKADVVAERREFDPRRPPPDMPPLGPHADAVTQSRFGCGASVQYGIVSRQNRGRAGCTATARIESVQVQVDLSVTIWVPIHARPKLVAHEEGHRVMSERVYNHEATAAAQKAAQKLVGRTVTAGGANCQAALDAAIKDANEQLCRDYLDLTSGWSTRLGDRYDELTDHGKRSRPDVEEAIRQSFELEPREPPETRGRLP